MNLILQMAVPTTHHRLIPLVLMNATKALNPLATPYVVVYIDQQHPELTVVQAFATSAPPQFAPIAWGKIFIINTLKSIKEFHSWEFI